MIKRLSVFIIIILILGLISIYLPEQTTKNSEKQTTQVTKIIDGDTIETSLGRIRLLGINTPEKNQPYYQEAKEFLKQIENKTIQIQKDKEDLDKYNRKLRYVFYKNRIINIEILEKGLATTFMIEDSIYKNKLKTAEEFAKINQLNLWKKSTEQCSECIQLQELNPEKEFFIIENICNIDCNLKEWTAKDNANHITKLSPLKAQYQQIYKSKSNIWNNEGDRLFVRDKNGSLVIFYEY